MWRKEKDRMVKFVDVRNYRNDIDGLRAIAVLAVIVFHFGYMPNGFLGVDVFFVISGYLITGIIYNELNENRFSMVNFYLRRTRRIIPLALFISIVTLVIGVATMLPDDLENLAQSVVATNLFSNNILLAITVADYWDVVNEYKPLMHTWSLGIEEQYYLFYPLLFLFVGKKRHAWLLPLLFFLTIASLMLCFSPYRESGKFYLIPFRFYELSIGGLAAICLKNKLIEHRFSFLLVFCLVFVLCFDFSFIQNQQILLLITVLLTVGILTSSIEGDKLSSFVLENKLMVALGTISFSLYMWHQVLLSYTRYFVCQKLGFTHLLVIFALTVIFSVLTYYLVEQPFRNIRKVNTRCLLLTLGLAFLVVNSAAYYIYLEGGVLKDVPELGIKKGQTEKNMHAKYNSRIYDHDKNFENTEKIKVLIIGHSFARDWANVLLESKYKEELDISYIYDPFIHKDLKHRVEESHVIFYSAPGRSSDVRELDMEESKLFVVGPKNFGTNSGFFYNYSGNDYFKQRTFMREGILQNNRILKQKWRDKYIDLIAKTIDKNQKVPVFTPSNQFISQDCRHFTKAGALYFAQLFENELASIFDKAKSVF